jgi:hypothetical protein
LAYLDIRLHRMMRKPLSCGRFMPDRMKLRVWRNASRPSFVQEKCSSMLYGDAKLSLSHLAQAVQHV